MSKKKRGNLPSGKWFYFPNNMIQSEPFKKLSTDAVWVLIQFINQKKSFTREYYDHDIPVKDREQLAFTYSQSREKMGSHRFRNSLKELMDNGFLVLVKAGGIYRQMNKYVLDNTWRFSDPKMINDLQEKDKKKEYARRYKSFGGALELD